VSFFFSQTHKVSLHCQSCAYVHVCKNEYVCVCVCLVFLSRRTLFSLRGKVRVYVFICKCVSTMAFLRDKRCAYAYMYTYIHAYVYTYTHAYMKRPSCIMVFFA
jgi:hypothetical protein